MGCAEALRLIEKEQITYFVGVPTMSLELMNHPDRGDYDLSSLTDIAAGGAPRPIAHVERLRRSFPDAQPALGYGLTETNAVGCAQFLGQLCGQAGLDRARRRSPSSSWRCSARRPASADRTNAARSASEPPPISNAIGAMRPRPPRHLPPTVILRTGDIGYLDEDGYLFIVDRKKDIIIRGGENIRAAEVEAALYASPDVAEAAVFGAPDERLGEVPIAVVHAREGSGLDEPRLRAFLDGKVAAFKIPARMIFSAEPLPRLGTGKIDRVELKEKHAG